MVGANNSGKTSAIDAIRFFLKKDKKLSTIDFTIVNWAIINKFGSEWIEADEENLPHLSIENWRKVIPSMDVWINVDFSELHYVSHLIPTLDWEVGKIGVRLSFEPKDVEKLYKDFKEEYKNARTVGGGTSGADKLKLWPNNLKEFLDKKLDSYFEIKSYILDPSQFKISENGDVSPQKVFADTMPLENNPFKNLFKIDIITAARGFSDANSDEGISTSNTGGLTSQSKTLFNEHLDPSKNPDSNDIDALIAIESARETFDEKLKASFDSVISELNDIGYPGFTDPQIKITSKVNIVDSLNHDSAIRFNVLNNTKGDENINYLPEKYNGLGYQNLISMVLKLIRFRYDWMRENKSNRNIEDKDSIIEPLHLVLIEEPEAHLHAQIQQVFINKAYKILRKHNNLKDSTKFNTQMLVSTHSSHIVHELDYKALRYFRRTTSNCAHKLPCSEIVNLSQVFGPGDETSKFVTRYLKLTHCDLFFADAAILVEGSAEKMLVPDFIKNHHPELTSKYITILDIGGAHAHRLKPLIEALKLITLIITDIDSIGTDGKKALPLKGVNYKTNNDTLKNWVPKKENIDDLLGIENAQITTKDGIVRAAYQDSFNVQLNDNEEGDIIPYTFEDALVFSNIGIFKNLTGQKGLIKKMQEAIDKDTLKEACENIFESLKEGKKAEMALELLFIDNTLRTPKYIDDGLMWLKEKLKTAIDKTTQEKINECRK